jgi:hypothetical protein
MPEEVRRLDVLIASPGDAASARDVVERAVHEWNGHRGDRESIVLRPKRWETDSIPIMGRGDAQSVINSQLVDDADIVFGIFYHRLGTSTPRAVSGTAEEIERSVDAGKFVHLYFSERDLPYYSDLDQFKALREFRSRLQDRGLVKTFKVESELWAEVSRALDYDIGQLQSISGW